MSNWRAILAHDMVCSEVFIECHCCNRRLDIAGYIDARTTTDEMAIKEAHKKNWTVGSVDGQTLCPKCRRLSDEEGFAIFVARLKDHYPHHELCSIWGESRRRYHDRKRPVRV